MALVVFDRVQETSGTTGTGTLTLTGAVPGYQTFAVVGDGNTTYYCILNGTDWEVGIGTYTASGTTLSRDTILSNSLGTTSPLNLSGGSAVFVTYPAEKSINYDANGVATIGSTLGYSDTGIIASFASTEPTYNQVVIQNKSTANTASANFNVSNDAATGTDNYAEFGINSSTFVGDSSFDLPGAAYLSSASTPLTIGTYAAEAIHFITNGDSTTTDAMTIYQDGSVTLGGLPASGIGNISCNNINLKFQQVTTSGGTTTLTNASPYYTQFTGTSAQDLVMPDATTCLEGTTFVFDNDSTQTVTIKDGAGTSFEILVPGGFHTFILEDNSTVAGTWLRYSQVPSTVEWGTYSLSLGATVISGGTWEGGTIQSGYGGTGLTTFSGANNALYSTSASTLTAGTLPVPAGGTGQTSFSAGYIPYGNTSAALQSSASLQFNGTYLVVGGTTPLGGATNPITAFSSTANSYVQTYVYNASTGGSASADFVSYADNSTDSHGWADLGFTSSTYNDAVYTVTGPNEAYLLGSAPTGAGATGNLVYATDSTGTENAHQWYVGGFTQAKSAYKMLLDASKFELKLPLYVTGSTGTSGQVLTSAGSGAAPTWSSLSSIGVTTFSAGTTGLTPSTATSGAITLAGTLGVANGGTGLTSLTAGYIPYGNGTSAFSSSSGLYFSGSNLGIGTSSPQAKLSVSNAGVEGFEVSPAVAIGGVIRQIAFNRSTSAYIPMRYQASEHQFYNATTSVALIDSSGNLGLGVTPSAWGGTSKAIQLPVGAIESRGTTVTVAQNAYFNGTSWVYYGSAAASLASQSGGVHYWYNAPSGSAGNAISLTQAMTLDGNGNLNVTSPAFTDSIITINSTSTNVSQRLNFTANGTIQTQLYDDSASTKLTAVTSKPLTFGTNNTERMRIDSSGNVGIGTSSPTEKLSILGGASAAGFISLRGNNNASSSEFLLGQASDGTTTYAFNRANGVLVFGTNNTECFRIGTSGQLGIGGANYGTSGQALVSQGSGAAPVWASVDPTVANGCIYENSQVISANYTITAGKNGMSAGPITINSGVTVTVPSGSTWTIV